MSYIIFAVWTVLMIRNTSVLYAGLTVLDRAGLAKYDKLPSYGEMFLNPKYWLLWTGEHWLAWIDRKSK